MEANKTSTPFKAVSSDHVQWDVFLQHGSKWLLFTTMTRMVGPEATFAG